MTRGAWSRDRAASVSRMAKKDATKEAAGEDAAVEKKEKKKEKKEVIEAAKRVNVGDSATIKRTLDDAVIQVRARGTRAEMSGSSGRARGD